MAGDEPWYPEASIPAYGDIVWGRFPEDEIPGPGPKERPVLVLAARVHRDKDPMWIFVQCAYGTSNISRRTQYALKIQNVSALNTARLPQATLFDLNRILWIPWSTRFFISRPEHLTPKIGNLPHEYMFRLEAIRALRQKDSVRAHANDEDDDED